MKIPKSIRVNGKKWTVGYKWGLRDPDTNEPLYGLNLAKTREILLDRGSSKALKKRAYIHEHCHALFVENNLRQLVSEDTEEMIVTVFENWICELLGVEDE